MRSDLELLTRFLVTMGGAQDRVAIQLRGKRNGTSNLRAGPFRGLDNFGNGVVQQFVIKRFQPNPDLLALHTYSKISVTTPAPTVRPPSRIAKRTSFSMAMGVISSTSTVTLS